MKSAAGQRRMAAGLGVAVLLIAGCTGTGSDPDGGQLTTNAPPSSAAPLSVQSGRYDLGDATLVDESRPEDSRFRSMPVRLNGVIAAPTTGGPYPVVVILHGTHPGCPVDDSGVDRWPCDPEVEQPNYAGFAWLAEELAARGYVAFAPNLNAEYTLGFGEPTPLVRADELVERHLAALAEAGSGAPTDFGVDLSDRVDLDRVALVGHSRGAEIAVALARDWVTDAPSAHGPASALLLLAPSPVVVPTEGGIPAPTGIVLPACDADVTNQDGQAFFESTRLAANPTPVSSLWLEAANHNNVNTELGPDPFGLEGRPDCAESLDPVAQRDVVGAYAVDVLTTALSADPQAVASARTSMGIAPAASAVAELYGHPAQAAVLVPDDQRLRLLTPTGQSSLSQGEGEVTLATEGLTTTYCPPGYYTPLMKPEARPCRRAAVVVPGQPAHIVASWEGTGASIRFGLPADARDLSDLASFSVRVGVDPLSELNAAGAPQDFTVRLTDASGATAGVAVGADQPALRFPAGESTFEEIFEEDVFSGRVPLMPVRVPLAEFSGVDLSAITEVAVVFDQTASGTLFLADAELLRG